MKAPLTHFLDFKLKSLIPHLIGKKLRFYIGNHDTRVGTANCFQFIEALAEASFQNRISSSDVELIIGPSIGHQGHGTSKEIFTKGADWMAEKLGVKK